VNGLKTWKFFLFGLLKKTLFGILWFFVIFIIAFFAGIPLAIWVDPAIGKWPINEITGFLGRLIFFGSLISTILLTCFEKLPGTKTTQEKGYEESK